MRALSAPELLDVWDRGVVQSPLERALTLLAAACSETPPNTLAELSIGQRDASLLTLREWTFGSRLVCLVSCAGCGERLELAFNAADVRVPPGPEAAEPLLLDKAGYEVRFRLPNSLDLAAVAEGDRAAAQQLLLERCLLKLECQGEEIAAKELPTDIVDEIAEHMARADPQADMQLALSCPKCNHRWQEIFDIGSFFWNEINAWAQRILREIHILASAYGWHEQDILTMSPWRRRFYLQLVSE